MTKNIRPSQAVHGGGSLGRAALLLLLGVAAGSCGSDSGAGSLGPLVRLHPTPLDGATAQITLSVMAPDSTGAMQSKSMTFSSPPFDVLGVSFAPGTRGPTSYQLVAADGQACSLGKGSAMLSLDNDTVLDVSVPMAATPLCDSAITVSVQVSSFGGATGTITSSPPGITCQSQSGTCSAKFPKGQPVTLSAQPSNTFAGWSGADCSGTGSCTFSPSADTQVLGTFSLCHGWCKETLPPGITANFNAVAGTSGTNVLVVGDGGVAVLWDGVKWQKVALPQNATTNLYAATALMGSDTIYAAGDLGLIVGLANAVFAPITNVSTATVRAASVGYGTKPSIFFVGDGGTGLVLSPGATAVVSPKSNLFGSSNVYTVSQNPGNNTDDLYVGGSATNATSPGYAQSWDGNTGLTGQMTGSSAKITGDIHAMVCGKSAHYAAGDKGAIVSRSSASGNSGKWVAVAAGATTQNLRGLWESADNNVFAVGDMGTILHYDGTAWTAASSMVMTNLRAVWGSSATNIYAVGESGLVLHYLP